MLEQFEKFKSKEFSRLLGVHVDLELHDAINVCAEMTWKECCEWVLSLIDKSNSDGSMIDYIRAEIGKKKKVTLPPGLDVADGRRPLCHTICDDEQRIKCFKHNNPMSLELCDNEKIVAKASDEATENLAGDDREHECKYSLSCKRDCCPSGDGYSWLAPGDGHRSQGWVPCDEFIPRNIIHHCSHKEPDWTCVWREVGEAPIQCVGYNNCDKYISSGIRITDE